MRNVVILGSTGSIGRQAIDVVTRRPDLFNVVGLAAYSDWNEIARQAALTNPDYVCLVDETAVAELRAGTGAGPTVLSGPRGLLELARCESADTVLNAVVGSAGLTATIAALEAGMRLALANKESLVAAGDLVNQKCRDYAGTIIPVDSEHSALWQCLIGEEITQVSRLILTASGGPFWGRDPDTLGDVTPAEALAHPRWEMGKRISIDSATLMNKGFEVIEAHHLFDFDYDLIDVLVHPQSIVHSLVEFVDGSLKAQLGPTDMRLPIQYGLTYPERIGPPPEPFQLAAAGPLDFDRLEPGQARCFDLALAAGRAGRSYPAVLNAADEVSVAAFLSGLIRFDEIGNIIDATLTAHEPLDIRSVEDFEAVDSWARTIAHDAITAGRTGTRSSQTFSKRGY